MGSSSVAPQPPPLPRRRRSLARALLGAFLCFALGGIAGFFCFTRVLPAWLAAEVEPALEAALGGPVSIGSLRPAFRFGIAFEAKAVEALPGPDGPALHVERMVARLSAPALARHRLRVRRIDLDGVRLRVAREPDGALAPAVLGALVEGPPDPTAARPDLPRQIEVHGLELTLRDVARDATWQAYAPALSLANRHGEGLALEAEVALERAAGRAAARPVGTVAFTAARAPDGAVTASATLRDVDLAALPAGALPRGTSGDAGGTLSLRLAAPGVTLGAASLSDVLAAARGELALALASKGLRVPTGDGGRLAADAATARARLTLAPGGFGVRGATLEADGFTLRGEASLARPLGGGASLALSLAAPELTPASARRLAAALPASLHQPLVPVLDRVEDGALRDLSLRGTAPLAHWQALVAGERGAWARGFREPLALDFDVAELAVRLDHGHRLENVRGGVSLRDDALAVRALAGRLDGEPTDELDLSLEGVSALLDARAPDGGGATSSEPFPGRGPILRILAAPPDADPPGWSELVLEVDRLSHALLLWPVVEASAVATPRPGGFHVALERARWGGVPVRGGANVVDGPPDRFQVTLVAGDAAAAPASAAPVHEGSASAEDAESWARGRYRLTLAPRGDDRVRSARGDFRASGPQLRLLGSELALAPGGRLRGEAELDLSHGDNVPYRARFAFDQASAADFMTLLGRASEGYRGSVEADGEIAGSLAPERSPIAGATGTARLEARDGALPTRIPLFLYLASASAGLNPFASRDRVLYRKIKGDLALADDRVSTENLELHGPDMRIGASGSLGVLDPYDVQSVVGIALRGTVSRTIGSIPLVGYLMLGRDKSLVSLWFHLEGPWADARARLIPMKTLAVGPAGMMTEGMPKFVERGIEALSGLLGREDDEVPAPAPAGAAPAEGLAP